LLEHLNCKTFIEFNNLDPYTVKCVLDLSNRLALSHSQAGRLKAIMKNTKPKQELILELLPSSTLFNLTQISFRPRIQKLLVGEIDSLIYLVSNLHLAKSG
jgi:hypothetical protein